MVYEIPKRKIVFIGDTPPDSDNLERFCWIDTVARQVKLYEGGQWVGKVGFADEPEGVSDNIKIAGQVLSFKNGVLVSYE